MYDLITPTEEKPTPPVRSVTLKKPGKSRGIRLIDLGSLLEYLDRQQVNRIAVGSHPPHAGPTATTKNVSPDFKSLDLAGSRIL
jgi:hypothetical protein